MALVKYHHRFEKGTATIIASIDESPVYMITELLGFTGGWEAIALGKDKGHRFDTLEAAKNFIETKVSLREND